MTARSEMEAVLEAILFVTSEPVSRDKLLAAFEERDREAAAEALVSVLERFREDSGRGVMVDEAGGGIRLVTRPELHGYLRRFFEISGRHRLSMAALETLAIVAYRQPITGPEVQELRGRNSGGVLKTLLERRLIRIAGRKEVVGKPFLYRTTREFLMHFGLQSLEDLPPLEEFEEAFTSEAEQLEIRDIEDEDREEQILRQVAEAEGAEDLETREDEETAGESLAEETSP